jgi:hypothetical protein
MLDDQNRGCEGHMLKIKDSPINLSLILNSKDDGSYNADNSPELATIGDIDRLQHLIHMA